MDKAALPPFSRRIRPVNRSRKEKRGTTLVELLVCLTFLSLTVYPMLSCVTYSIRNSQRSQEQMVVMGLIQDALDTQRATALSSALTAGTTSVNYTPTTTNTQVTVTTTIALVTGYTDLYQVTVTGTWNDATVNFNNSSLVISTYMRAPHV